MTVNNFRSISNIIVTLINIKAINFNYHHQQVFMNPIIMVDF